MRLTFEAIISAIITTSVISVFAAIFIDFALFDAKDNAKESKKSIVSTGTMIGFFLLYYAVLRLKLGGIPTVHYGVITLGTLLIVAGAICNIVGRLALKGNWANHIKIYRGHTFVTSGLYGIVRHPLYSSIMLMLLGGSIAYRNWLSAVLTFCIFIPFMYYRARQEEALLTKEFGAYSDYQKKVGMFFPKIGR